jgi:(E)-4-hydroxy-3-methyl-but-2-enyl pyrophosphate reductase
MPDTTIRTVRLAREVGFCFGVKRAIGLTEQALDEHQKVSILGDLVHNRNVTSGLKARGLRKVGTLEEAGTGTMVVRAHGLPKADMRAAESIGLQLVDATCPIVLRAQEAAKTLEERGCQVVVIGDKDHAEVRGILGSLDRPALVVDSVAEVREARAEHRLRRKVGVVLQTTHSLELCQAIIAELLVLCKDIQIINTICRPVQNRQDDAVDLAQSVDLMVIVGSRTSANTMELATLCRKYNPYTVQIESASDLPDDAVAWAATVGIASGLSTPEETVEGIADYVRAFPEPIDPTRRPDPDTFRGSEHATPT